MRKDTSRRWVSVEKGEAREGETYGAGEEARGEFELGCKEEENEGE